MGGIKYTNPHTNLEEINVYLKKKRLLPSFYYILLTNCHCILAEFHPNKKNNQLSILTKSISSKSITEASKYSKLLNEKIYVDLLH